MNRRKFIKLSALGTSLPFSAGLLSQQAQADALQSTQAMPLETQKKIVVLVELRGGNDSLNTLIPFTDPLYYKLRPTLAIPRSRMLPITRSLAMHPEMRPLLSYWHNQEMAWIQGVGYANGSRSHFRSIDIWNTASNYNQYTDEGWVARLLGSHNTIPGLAVNTSLGPLAGSHSGSIKINDVDGFIHSDQYMSTLYANTSNNSLAHLIKTESLVAESASTLGRYVTNTPDEKQHFPNTALGREFASIARLINSGIGIPSYKVSLSNFDTHSNQTYQHNKLLKELANNLHAFAQNMIRNNYWDNVILMTYSEFGRQVTENGSQGTDHGEAGAHLVMGGKVKGQRIIGINPDLNNLHNNALSHTVNIRSVYGTIATRWWGLNNPWNQPVLSFV
jgi:uncharacterized protein (DUF1501 family)